MTTSEGTTRSATAVGVFKDKEPAEQAVAALEQAGFDGIGCATGSLGFLQSLRIQEQERLYYETELEAGRTIVTVSGGERFQEADAILRRFGAYVYSGPYHGV